MAVADNIELLRPYAAGGSEEGFAASTSTLVNGTLKLMTQTKLRTAAVVCTSFLLTAAAARGVAAQATAKGAQIQLPREARQQWEKQKAALRAVYLEFTETSRGTLTNWDYAVAPAYSPYLAGSHFMQDPIEYESRTHHSSADVYERIQPEDMQFNTAVLASFAWLAAQRDEEFPR